MRKLLFGIVCLGLGACATSANEYDRRASKHEYRAAREAARGDYDDAARHQRKAREYRKDAAERRVDQYYDNRATLPPPSYY